MKNIVVNVQTYGDFDIPGTACVMLAPEYMTKSQIKSMVKLIQDDNRKTNDPDAAIEELKKLGFQSCSTVDLTVGGGL